MRSLPRCAAKPVAPQRRPASHVVRSSRDPRPENVDGQFYVDHTCIDCDTCRWMAPDTFGRAGSMSAVHRQPETREGRIAAVQATLSCPTFSIHMRHNDRAELKAAQEGMPIPVPECPGVYHCGFHAEKSFGATSYLIQREPELGNILVDAPRYNPLLAKKLQQLGGVKYIFLSHIDDIGDHDKWAAKFGATRIIHTDEVRPHIADIEIQLQGTGPWNMAGETIAEDDVPDGIQLVHTPGHTTGCVTLWHAPTKTMFTGDHLGYSSRVERPSIFPRYNRAGIQAQLDSVEKLLAFDFEHVLPGHGRRFHVDRDSDRHQMFESLRNAELAIA